MGFYVLWRNSVGQTSTFPNDPNVGTTIDEDQYNTWRPNFGNMNPPGSSAVAEQSSAVPEPSSAMLVVSAFAAVAFAVRWPKQV